MSRLCLKSSSDRNKFYYPYEESKEDDRHEIDDFDGLFLIENFLSEEEEASLVEQIEADPNWKESQSGRRKIDYGP